MRFHTAFRDWFHLTTVNGKTWGSLTKMILTAFPGGKSPDRMFSSIKIFEKFVQIYRALLDELEVKLAVV